MILGLGSDIADIKRIEAMMLEHGARFLERCFTTEEQDRVHAQRKDKQAATLAKRFAAKEACAKALGTGIAHGVYLRDIGVENTKDGAPILKLRGGAEKRLKNMTPEGYAPRLHLSLSDEPPLAKAIVIIEALSPQEIKALEQRNLNSLA